MSGFCLIANPPAKFTIGGFDFKGPFATSSELPGAPGILMIVKGRASGTCKPLNLYATANLKSSASLELAYHSGGPQIVNVAYMPTDNLTAQMSTSLAAYLSDKFALDVQD